MLSLGITASPSYHYGCGGGVDASTANDDDDDGVDNDVGVKEEGAVHGDKAFEAQPFPPESFSQAHGNYDGDVGVDDHDH